MAVAKDQVAAVDRVITILECLDGTAGQRLAEIARKAGLSEATALRYLNTLSAHGYAERDVDGRFRLGSRLFRLGWRSLSGGDPRQLALPLMESLRLRFNETVNLAMRSGDDLLLIEAAESTRAIRMGSRIGDPDVWHASAVGKAILANLPRVEQQRILERHGYPRRTANTLATLADLARDFKWIKEVGYSVDNEESEEDLFCVAAAVFDRTGSPAYALSMSGPASRLRGHPIEDLASAVRNAAESLSRRLGAPIRAADGTDGRVQPL